MSELNLIDKVKSYFDPKYAYQASMYRSAAKLFSSGGIYDGAMNDTHYQIGFETTEDDDIADLYDLRNTSRLKYKNNGFIEGLINCAVDHVVGDGLTSKSTINFEAIGITEERANEVGKIIDNYFNSWANSTICDATAKDNFNLLQRLAYQTYLIDGDCFAALPLTNLRNGKVIQIDLIGSEYIDSLNKLEFIEGIKVSKNKMPLQYSIKQNDNTYKVISAFKNGKRNVLHLFKRNRIKTVRGIPFATSLLRDAEYIDQYMKYELGAAKLSAIFFGSVTTNSPDSPFGDSNSNVDFLTGEQKQTTKNTVKQNSITTLAPGDKLDIHTTGRNNPSHEQFVMTSLKKFSSAKRIPLEIILAQFVSSYSASRAAMISMQKFIKPERELFLNSFNNPIRNQVITWGVLQGDLDIPEFFDYRNEFLKCRWLGEPAMSVDPMKDINTAAKAIDYNLVDREQTTLKLGYGEFEDIVTNIKKEKEMLDPLREEQNNDN